MQKTIEGKTLNMTPVEFDGDMYFLPEVVGEALGYKNLSDSIAHSELQEGFEYRVFRGPSKVAVTFKLKEAYPNLNFNRRSNSIRLITESGLYMLIMRSQKPVAIKFSKWLRCEVLPAIRRFGKYTAPLADDMGRLPEEFHAALDMAETILPNGSDEDILAAAKHSMYNAHNVNMEDYPELLQES